MGGTFSLPLGEPRNTIYPPISGRNPYNLDNADFCIDIPAHKWAEHLVFMRVLGTANTSLCNLYKRLFLNFCLSSMDGRPRPGLPSGKECCKQSDPEQSGCPSVRRLLDVYGESETPSTQHRRLRLLRSSKAGETSGVCLRSQAKLITQSRALRYQIRLRSMKVNVSSPNHPHTKKSEALWPRLHITHPVLSSAHQPSFSPYQ